MTGPDRPSSPGGENATTNGYASRRYAESLRDFGEPRLLPRCRGWLLQREIPGTDDRDAMGCYPLFSCASWRELAGDLLDLGGELVSVSLVPDPFGDYSLPVLKETFSDVCRPFKRHFVVDLEAMPEKSVSKHHRYYARRALRKVRVEVCTSPLDHLDEWVALYADLIDRHGLRGIQAFSRDAFARQMEVPGMVMLRALDAKAAVGAHLWLERGSVVTSHLAAFSPAGYELAAAYALYWEAIRHFSGMARWLNLGGGAGLRDDPEDGLARFKRGWSSDVRTAYFCGRILDPDRYRELTAMAGRPAADYFPAYRSPQPG